MINSSNCDTGQLNMRPADGDGGYYHDTDKKLYVKLSASIWVARYVTVDNKAINWELGK